MIVWDKNKLMTDSVTAKVNRTFTIYCMNTNEVMTIKLHAERSIQVTIFFSSSRVNTTAYI